jgi:AcrR family transcriptional regulator
VRQDAVRNQERILGAARDVFGEAGADACMEEIAARACVGVGTVYRRFASKDALIDELLRVALEELAGAARGALERTDGHGLEDLLRAFGRSFADHARYADLLMERQPDAAATEVIRAATSELTSRAVAFGAIGPGVTLADVMALVSAMRGLARTDAGLEPRAWQRFLDIHLAGLRTRQWLPRREAGEDEAGDVLADLRGVEVGVAPGHGGEQRRHEES